MTLYVTIGPPGSGKSTRAARWRDADPANRARLSRDGLREAMGVGGDADTNPPQTETMVSLAQRAAMAAWLHAGLDVTVDATCQTQAALDSWVALAAGPAVEVVVWDFRSIPLEVCLARDTHCGRAGGRHVGDEAIRRVAARCATVRIPHHIRTIAP